MASVAAFFITYHKFHSVILQRTGVPFVFASVFAGDVYFNFKTNGAFLLFHIKNINPNCEIKKVRG